MSDAERPNAGWLFGPFSDVFVGCGLGSILLIATLALTGNLISSVVPASLLILFLAVPHYGATLIRVYESESDRRHYSFFSVWCSVAVALALVLGLENALFGSLVLTLYLTWSPWHYTGQNYGVFLMLLARRGVQVDPTTKRLAYASFALSFGMTFLAIHGVDPRATYAPVSYQGTVYSALSLGIPLPLAGVALATIGSAYLVASAAALIRLLRAAGWAAIAPSLVLAVTQSLWFAVPVTFRFWGSEAQSTYFASAYTAYGFVWIAAFHSAQYLWITTYYAAGHRPRGERVRFVAKSTVAGYAIWTLPVLLLGPSLFGSLPHESGLALLVAATVNLHHFILDGAIWKLRDGRVARLLLRSASSARATTPDAATIPNEARAPWLRRSIYTVGALCVIYAAATFWEEEVGFARSLQERDLGRAVLATDRLAMLGRESASRHRLLGQAYANRGELTAAMLQFEQSLAVLPTTETFRSMGKLRYQQADWRAALDSYDALLEIEPNDAEALFRSGLALMKLGTPSDAIPRLERALLIEPNVREIQSALRRARLHASSPSDDVEHRNGESPGPGTEYERP